MIWILYPASIKFFGFDHPQRRNELLFNILYMIPKLIHYCWFGRNPLPSLAVRCIESWVRYLPDYEIEEWNEDNFDITSNSFVKEAYESKKYAFVSDFVRLYALYHYGGIYMDTDVEVIRSLDVFLDLPAFSGFEDDNHIPTGIMASEQYGVWAKSQLAYYSERNFIKPDGTLDMTTNVAIIGHAMAQEGFILKNSFQNHKDIIHIFPKDYFCPKDHGSGEIIITDNTYCIHHFAMSWMPKKQARLSNLKRALIKVFGAKTIDGFIKIFHLKQVKDRLLK